MPKLTTTAAKRTLVITGLVASLMVAIVVFSVNSHSASAQSLTSSLKQKASSMVANKTGGNTTNSARGGNKYIFVTQAMAVWQVNKIDYRSK